MKNKFDDDPLFAPGDDIAGPLSPASLGALANDDYVNAVVSMTPGGIERQEAQGQTELCAAEKLPKNLGAWNRGDIKKEYAKHGIEVLGDADDIFFNVKLPEGWKLVPTNHSMHNDLLDEKGRKRAGIFYKAAFYDRSAYINFCTRFNVVIEPQDAYKDAMLSHDDRKKMLYFGRVYDGDNIIFETEGYIEENITYEEIENFKKEKIDLCKQYMIDEGYFDYENPTFYWSI